MSLRSAGDPRRGGKALRDEPARLEFTQFGDDVIALAAAALVMDQLFEHVEITGSR